MGLGLVRARDAALLGGAESVEAQVDALCAALRATRGADGQRRLAWIEPIDVEQALCEYSKYAKYSADGVRGSTFFQPGVRGGAACRS